MLHHFFSNYGIAFYYPNDLFLYVNTNFNSPTTAFFIIHCN